MKKKSNEHLHKLSVKISYITYNFLTYGEALHLFFFLPELFMEKFVQTGYNVNRMDIYVTIFT